MEVTRGRDNAGPGLRDVFERPLAHARQRRDMGAGVIGVSWPTVPWELMHASGFAPVVLRRNPGPTPHADTRLESGVFASRIRGLVDAALGGELTFLDALVIPRTAEQDYKAYLYVREFVRGGATGIPVLHLFDLLQTDSPESRAYGLARTAELQRTLETMTGRSVTNANLDTSIALSNHARAAARTLIALRRHPARVSGAEIFPLLAAFWLTPHEEYAAAALTAGADLALQPPLSGPRILLVGAPVDHTVVHVQIERHGAVVVAEDTPWGTRAAGDDVATGVEPLQAIFDKYYADVPSARARAAASDKWFAQAIADEIDGVVFVLPEDDSVFGWEYPARRRLLDARGLPSLVVREELETDHAAAATADRIAAFVARAAQHSTRGVHG